MSMRIHDRPARRASLMVVSASRSSRVIGLSELADNGPFTVTVVAEANGGRLSTGGWHINIGHPDYLALAPDARARLRYMVALFAKDLTVSATHPANEGVLDQMIDVIAHAERNLLRAPR